LHIIIIITPTSIVQLFRNKVEDRLALSQFDVSSQGIHAFLQRGISVN